MSLFTRSGTGLTARAASSGDARRVLEFLDRAPAENVYLSHLILRDDLDHGGTYGSWYVALREGEVCGVCVAWGNVVPAAADIEAARALAEAVHEIRPGTQSLVGERSAVNAMWQILRRRAPAVRLVREEQPFYLLERDDLDPAAGLLPPSLRLRPARAEDLDLVVSASAAMLREEILDDPYGRDPVGFRSQIWRMVRSRSFYVLEAEGTVVFKAHTNVRTPLAAQISGVYTLPAHRGLGYARAGMSALARELLQEHPRLCLYVNRENGAAIRTYEATGFRRSGTFKSIFFASGG